MDVSGEQELDVVRCYPASVTVQISAFNLGLIGSIWRMEVVKKVRTWGLRPGFREKVAADSFQTSRVVDRFGIEIWCRPELYVEDSLGARQLHG